MLLAIETATDVCSVVFENDAGDCFEKRTDTRGSHSEKLFLFVRELMHEHSFAVDQLEGVIVSRGPGSYTGLRIAASGVKGLLFAADVPLYAASTLASYAAAATVEATPGTLIHAVIDARRVHMYHQSFRAGPEGQSPAPQDDIEIIPIADIQKMLKSGDHVIGSGIERFGQHSLEGIKVMDEARISAGSLLTLFHSSNRRDIMEAVSPDRFEPLYYTSGQVQ